MEKIPGAIVEKNGQEQIDFNSAFLDKTIEDINKENHFFKLNPGDILYDGENFIVDHKKMTLDELKKQVKDFDSIMKKEFLDKLKENRQKENEEADWKKTHWWD
jgi:hypothetical protein